MILRDKKTDQIDNEYLPAGEYYIGDLCYVLDDKDYRTYFNLCFPTARNKNPEIPDDVERHNRIHLEGVMDLRVEKDDFLRIASLGTAHGDGVYSVRLSRSDNRVGRCGVDSGAIGCVLLEKISDEKLGGLEFGYTRKFKKPFRIKWEVSGGVIAFEDDENHGVYLKTGDEY